jgi:hypothetical protein
MEQFNVQFKLPGQIDPNSSGDVAAIIKQLSDQAVKANESFGKSYYHEMINNLKSEVERIRFELLVQYGTPFSSAEVSWKDIEYDAARPSWKVLFTLTSYVYTCINILAEKIIVCYKEGDDTIYFIPMLKNMLLIQNKK